MISIARRPLMILGVTVSALRSSGSGGSVQWAARYWATRRLSSSLRSRQTNSSSRTLALTRASVHSVSSGRRGVSATHVTGLLTKCFYQRFQALKYLGFIWRRKWYTHLLNHPASWWNAAAQCNLQSLLNSHSHLRTRCRLTAWSVRCRV